MSYKDEPRVKPGLSQIMKRASQERQVTPGNIFIKTCNLAITGYNSIVYTEMLYIAKDKINLAKQWISQSLPWAYLE